MPNDGEVTIPPSANALLCSLHQQLDRLSYRAISYHHVDVCIRITKLAQHLARMLSDARCRSSDRCFIDGKSRRWIGLPYPSYCRLLKFGNDTARYHLFIADNLMTTQNRGTWHVRRIETRRHSAVGCCAIYSCILLMRAVALTDLAVGVANRASLVNSGSPDALQKPFPAPGRRWCRT